MPISSSNLHSNHHDDDSTSSCEYSDSMDNNHNDSNASINADKAKAGSTNSQNKMDFAKNWASCGSNFDKTVLGFPIFYPDRDVCIEIAKVEDKEEKKTRIGWAHRTNHGKSKCLGVYVCPKFRDGCFFREQPKVARSGKKVVRGNPPPKNKCSTHPEFELTRIECKCEWTYRSRYEVETVPQRQP